MYKTNRFPLFFVLLVLLLAGACKPNPADDYIQGTWAFANESGDERSGTAHVFNQWWFGSGLFFFQNEVVMGSPDVAEGRYRILEWTEDSMVLELYMVRTNTAFYENQQVNLRLERETDEMRIGRVLYYRAGP